ncbi:MAG: hypothetical protein Q8M15_05680 [Bacteroidota bacterium]|nr:hypothetical protein [Bacteroidota bacterium]
MKALKYSIITLAALILIVITACKKELKGPDENLSSLSSITLGTANAGTPYYTLDNTGKYLILFVRDLNYNNGVVQKINISGSIPILEKTITINGTVPISPDNVVVTDDNQFIGTFFFFGKPSAGLVQAQLIYKFDINLNITKIDTIVKSLGGNFGRTRLVKNGKGKITGVFSNKPTGRKTYLTYKEMDENLNILDSKTDSLADYGTNNLSGTNLIKTSDEGYLFCGDNSDIPYVNNIETILQKRDKNFNLLWTVKHKATPPNIANPAYLHELNGRYYVYCANSIIPQTIETSTYVLVYDINGNLLQNKPMPIDGIVFRGQTTTEPMRMTDNGEFFILASAKLNTAPNLTRGIIYRTDANLNVLSSEVYGGKGVVGSLIKINANRYLHFYLDNNFTPDNNLPRLVFRYIDAKGKVIE